MFVGIFGHMRAANKVMYFLSYRLDILTLLANAENHKQAELTQRKPLLWLRNVHNAKVQQKVNRPGRSADAATFI